MSNYIVSYSKEFLDIIKSLTAVQIAQRFYKENNNVICQMADDSKTMAYRVEAPLQYFDFDGQEVNFKNFPEFYSLLKVYESASISHIDNNMIISSNNSSIKYVLSNPKAMPKSPVSLSKKDPDVTFILSVSDLKEIAKMSNYIRSDYINIKYENKMIYLKLFNSAHDNNFTKKITPEFINISQNEQDIQSFEFSTREQVFSSIPNICDYRVFLTKTGNIRLEWKIGDVSFMCNSGKVAIPGQVR